jgi:hypothetical protein
MLQGPPFHSLYTFGVEQIYRVADAAFRARYQAIVEGAVP